MVPCRRILSFASFSQSCAKFFAKNSISKNFILGTPSCFISNYTAKELTQMDLYNQLQLNTELINSVADDAIDYASTHGMVMKNRKHLELNNYAPFVLFPSPFPEYLYTEAEVVQKDFHTLIHRLKQDESFLKECLSSVILHDDFTKRLYEIYEEVKKEGVRQPINLMLIRSDYMIHDTFGLNSGVENINGYEPQNRRYEMKQIEVNLIASSFSGLGTVSCQLHKHVADRLGSKSPFCKDKIPHNDAVRGLGFGIAKAWKAYGNDQAVVVFVIQAGEKNRYDQRLLEYQFYDGVKSLGCNDYVPVFYRSMEEIYREGKLTDDFKLIVNGREVAVVYFRAGYSPADYSTEECWKSRLLIEKSIAIKSPDISGHLLGCKKVQQVLANPGVLERFIEDKEALKRIRNTFAGLYSLDPGPEGDETEKMALQNPSKFVLKPQREGGGNNVYGEEMVEVLKSLKDPQKRGQYILMERVNTPIFKNYLVHIDHGTPQLLDVVNELGIYGVLILNGEQKLVDETVGYLVRTKSIEFDDGGVAAGRAVLDSLHLF